MNSNGARIIVVTGATGRQGGAVARALLADGWHVRAVTRKPDSPRAQALSAIGAEIVQADMNDRQSLQRCFQGVYGIYSVQNPMMSGLAAEVSQGKNVADAASEANVQHLVYGSAGFGKPTGVGSWDSKIQVEAHMQALGLPITILRPMAFMELMTDQLYYPAVSTWHLMPMLMGENRPIGWISVEDVGIIAAKAFASPEHFVGQVFNLASDIKSIAECRAIYRQVLGKLPPYFPMPVWMFKLVVGSDLITMWHWLRTGEIDLNTQPTHAIHPNTLSLEMWLRKQRDSRRS